MQIPEFHIERNISSGIRTLAMVGHFAKGTVYLLAGTLTALAAFNLGGEKSGNSDVFEFVRELPLGQVLLMLLAIGLLSYVFWRLVQAVKDPGHSHGHSAKRIGKRFGYAWSGLIYGSLAYLAAKIALGNGGGEKSGGGVGSNQDSAVATVRDWPAGHILLLLVALGIAGFGLYQFYRAYSGNFMTKLKQSEIETGKRKMYERAGRFGYAARGVMLLAIAYLFYQAVSTASSTRNVDNEGAFNLLETIPFGNWVLGLVALGLIGYGIFMFVKGKHNAIPG